MPNAPGRGRPAAPSLHPLHPSPPRASDRLGAAGARSSPTRGAGGRVKRVIDVVGGALALVLALPVLAVASALVLFEDGRPVIYRQRRAGLGARDFVLLKLRSMRADAPPAEALGQVDGRHPMVTRVGRVLRRSKVDELPQLINVLCGDMSLIGPRPVLRSLADGFDDFARRRLRVRPGLTGWAQVNGNVNLSWQERIALDVWYVDHWSLRLDATILIKTLGVVLRGERRNERALREALAHADGARRSG